MNDTNSTTVEPIKTEGLLEVAQKNNYARLLQLKYNGKSHSSDVYVPQSLVQKLKLKTGQYLVGSCVQDHPGKAPRMIRVDTVDGLSVNERRQCMAFADATTTSPNRQLRTETGAEPLTTRVMDLFAPIGRGQRCLVVAPPKAGKTTILQHLALGILKNEPDCHVMVLLVDERPEEVTDFKRNVPAEIFASSNDEPISRHIHVAQLAFQRAQNLVETGRHVVLLVDSLTRLSRAFNNTMGRSGRTMTGGLDVQALEKPRQLFSMARNTEEIGSLTVIATILIETGSRMDDLIFQEFKGTGNCEIILDRKLSERRIFPAINVLASGTRREEFLLSEDALEATSLLRRAFAGVRPEEATESLIQRMKKTASNAEFIKMVCRAS